MRPELVAFSRGTMTIGRPRYLLACLLIGAATVLWGDTLWGRTQAPATRPNILVLFADDWSWPHASAYGDPVVRTPNFDRIAREGALFTHAFSAAPSCTPSRASLLTGRAVHSLEEGGNLWSALPSR